MAKILPPFLPHRSDLWRDPDRRYSCLWLCSWERERGEEVETSAKKGLLSTLLSLAKDMRSTFYLRVFRKHLGMYLCGFGAEWLFASIFTYFVIFVLQHDPAMVAGLNSLNSILQLISTALFIGLCVKKGFSKPYILALGIVIFAVLLYTSLWFFHLPSGLATVLMFGITVLFAWVPAGFTIYPGPFTPSWPMSMRSTPDAGGKGSMPAP